MEKTRDKLFRCGTTFICIVLMISMCWNLNVINAKEKVQISNTSLELDKGTSKKLKLLNVPSNATIKWKTTNKYALTVSKKGKVKAVNSGNAVIKATYKGVTYTCAIKVPDPDRKIRINCYNVTLNEGKTFQLATKSTRPVTYHSENESIATVDTNGLITAINPGVTTITVKTETTYTRCTVNVDSNDVTVRNSNWLTNKKVTGVRRLTKKNHIVYDNITWAKNKDITFKIDNLDENNIKKCVWSSTDETIVSVPKNRKDSKIIAEARTLKQGTAIIRATVTDKEGNENIYSNYVYVSAPSVNTSNVIVYGPSAGEHRQQYISFAGLNKYSKVKWSNSNTNLVTFTEYNTKIALSGLKEGSGTITASVDGKSYKINYVVINPVFGKIAAVIPKGKTTRLSVSGIKEIIPLYSIRNKNVATVKSDGTIKGKKSGVTYLDVKIGSCTFSYRVEVAAKGVKKIIDKATYIVNHWKYSQAKRMKKGYYDCSALVWKGYKAYKSYQKRLSSKYSALPAGELFDYLYKKGQIVYFGYIGTDNMKPGDLIFYGDYASAVRYSTPGRTLDIYHVAMYAGHGQVVEKGGQTMNYNNIRHIVGIGRVID